MTSQNPTSSDSASRPPQAHAGAGDAPDDRKTQTLEVVRQELHEWHAQRAEAEMRNGKLRQIRAELDAERAHQEMFSLFMRHSPIYAFIKTVTPTESRVLQASDNYQQMLGLPGSEMTGKTMAELFPPDLAAKITTDDWAVVARGERLELEEEFNGRVYTTLKFPITQGDKTLLAGYTIDITGRKQAEKALQNSESRYRELFELAVDGILTGSHDGVILDANRSFCDLLGLSREELVGKAIFNLPFTRESLEKTPFCFDLLRQGQTVTSERTLARLDGSEIEIEMRTKMMPDGTYQSIYRDVTERKRMEKQLAAEREHYFNFYHLSPVGYFSLDEEGLILEVNRTSATLLGVGRGALIKQPISPFIFSADLNLYDRCCQQLVETNLPQACEVRMVNLARTLFWAHLDMTLVLVAGGVSVRRIVLSDITERVQTQAALQANERKYRLLVETLQEGIWSIDQNATTTFVNPCMASMLGYRMEDMVGQSLFSFMDDRNVALAKNYMERRKPGNVEQHEFEFIRKNGEQINAIVTTAPLVDENGHLIGALGGVIDITERKRMEETLQASKTRLRQLVMELARAEEREQQRLAVCLHDEVAQTLALLRIRLGTLATTLGDGPAQGEITHIRDQLEKTLDQTRSLVFDLSPPVLHQLGLVAAMAWAGEKLCRDHGLIFVGRDHGEPSHLNDEQKTLLFRCVRELMMNTVKHAKATRLMAAVEDAGDHIRVTIEDDGCGFDVSCLDRRGQAGFGLFSVQERLIVAGGQCMIASTPGGGTQVTLTLSRH